MTRRVPRTTWVVGCLGALAVGLSLAAAIAKAPLPGDLALARWIQDMAAIDAVAPLVNGCGDWRWAPAVALLVATVAASVAGSKKAGCSAGVSSLARAVAPIAAVGALSPISDWLKEIIQSPRPAEASGLAIDRVRADFGFPSGHVYGDVLVYGFIFAAAPGVLPRPLARGVQAICGALIVLAGPARVSVGAHWPSDTIGGYLWGGVALSLVLLVRRLTSKRA
jgi:undecaprenyl-diphosphatase